jgi:mono/diheme cytochrome c family protein
MKLNAVVIFGTLLLTSGPAVLSAQDAAALYRTKCAACHGASGEGKAVMKAPALKGTQLDAGQITAQLTKGDPAKKAPHNKAITGLKPDQAKALAEYVKGL